MICRACSGVGRDANANFYCSVCDGNGSVQCPMCAAGYPVSEDGEHFAGDELQPCTDWFPPEDGDEDDGEPDFTTDEDPIDPTMEGWRP